MNERYLFANLEIAEADGDPSLYIQQALAAGHRIPKKPNEAVARTLQSLGLKDYPSPVPPLDNYIATLVKGSRQSYPGTNYGTFVELENGTIAFAKLRYGPINIGKVNIDGKLVGVPVGGLERESQVMRALAEHGYQLPELFGYYPATPVENSPEPDQAHTLEILIEESIPHHKGSTFTPERWTPELSRIAAQKIRTFSKPSAEVPLFKDEERKLPYQVILERARLSSHGDYAQSLKAAVDAYPDMNNPIVVHGDTWPKNIIVSYDQKEMLFVDWEMAGAGYVGQDAARTLWGLTTNKNWAFVDVNESARIFINEWSQTKEARSSLRFGTYLESLRWIADRQDIIQQSCSDPETKLYYEKAIESVKAHTLKILAHIPES